MNLFNHSKFFQQDFQFLIRLGLPHAYDEDHIDLHLMYFSLFLELQSTPKDFDQILFNSRAKITYSSNHLFLVLISLYHLLNQILLICNPISLSLIILMHHYLLVIIFSLLLLILDSIFLSSYHILQPSPSIFYLVFLFQIYSILIIHLLYLLCHLLFLHQSLSFYLILFDYLNLFTIYLSTLFLSIFHFQILLVILKVQIPNFSISVFLDLTHHLILTCLFQLRDLGFLQFCLQHSFVKCSKNF